jgi:hypothetical protein
MSNYAPNEDTLGSRIERAIDQDTNDFNQLIEIALKIVGFD